MTVMILAHGGHIAMFVVPVAAVVYLVVALRGDAPKNRGRAATPVLPSHPFGRQVRSAMSPPKAKKPTTAPPPVPERFAPGRAARKRARGGTVVPLHVAPRSDQGPDSPSLPSAWNQ